MSEDCPQVVAGRQDRQNICTVELILLYFAWRKKRVEKCIKISGHHVICLFMSLGAHCKFRTPWTISTKFRMNITPVNDVTETYIVTYDRRTILAPLIVAFFFTGLHKYFGIIGPRWGTQGRVTLGIQKYGAWKCRIRLHKRTAPRDLCNPAFIGILAPCGSVIRRSVLE